MKLAKILFVVLLIVNFCKVDAQAFVNPYKRNTGAFQYDKGINGVLLYDDKSLVKQLGQNVWELHQFEPKGSSPLVECFNSGQTQILRVFFTYGGFKNEPSGFQMLQKPTAYRKPAKAIVSKMASFKSQRGIVLGMAKNEVVKILGRGFESRKEKNGMETITYYTNKQEDNVFKEYNGVGYSIIAVFKNNKLMDYSFGFEYP